MECTSARKKCTVLGTDSSLCPGIGTVEELMEIYTWLQLGYHHKPVGLLNTNDYYGHLIDFLKHSEREGFLQKECLSVLCIDDDPVRLIDKMEATGTDLPDKLGT